MTRIANKFGELDYSIIDGSIYIDDIYVNKHHRGKGWGGKLITKLKFLHPNMNMELLAVPTDETDHRSTEKLYEKLDNFYTQHGFRKIEGTTKYVLIQAPHSL